MRLAVLCILLFLSGCYYDIEEELYPVSNISGCDTTPPLFSTKISAIINGNCAVSGCHVEGSQSPNLSGYNNVTANISRIRVRAVVEKTMPPTGPLNPCDINALQTWINNGMPN